MTSETQDLLDQIRLRLDTEDDDGYRLLDSLEETVEDLYDGAEDSRDRIGELEEEVEQLTGNMDEVSAYLEDIKDLVTDALRLSF